MTAKTAERTTAILDGYDYGHDVSGLWGVLYLAPTERDVERLRRLATSAGLGPRRDQRVSESFVDELRKDVWFLAGRIDAIEGLAACLADYDARHAAAVAERTRRRVERREQERIEREQWQAENAARRAAEEQRISRQEAERAAALAAAKAEAARPINRMKRALLG